MILLEAVASRRPFVSTPVGGIPDLAIEAGMLVPVGRPLELAAALIRFLADRSHAAEVGDRAYASCRSTRSVDAVDARFRALYAAIT
jgi:glycosyltransferase involved in cell wall biosynthesis